MLRTAAFAAVLALSACGTPTSPGYQPQGQGPSSLAVHLAGTTDNLIISPKAFTEAGIVKRLDVRISVVPSRASHGRNAEIAIDQNLARRVAVATQSGQDAAAVTELAMIAARSTYCRSGPITPNNGIVRFSDPAAIQAIAAENARLNRDAVPPGLKGEPVPATSYRPDGYRPWEVSLLCNAPNPYP